MRGFVCYFTVRKTIYHGRQLYRSDVMVSVLASSAVDRGIEPRSDQTKDYNIGICCFSTKHAVLMRKTKDWLPPIQDNVPK